MLKFLFLLGVALQPFQVMGQGNMYNEFSMKVNLDDDPSICLQMYSKLLLIITSGASMDTLKQIAVPMKEVLSAKIKDIQQPFQAMGQGNMYKEFPKTLYLDNEPSICVRLYSQLGMIITSGASMDTLKQMAVPMKDSGLCPAGFTKYPRQNKCYKAFPDKVNWDEALNTCGKLGSHLVTITSDDSKSPLKDVVDPIKASCLNLDFDSPAFWTAGKRISSDKFIWIPNRGTKMEMTYTNWGPGEPNNVGGNEDCLHFLSGDNNLFWYDSNCEMVQCFVCEVDL